MSYFLGQFQSYKSEQILAQDFQSMISKFSIANNKNDFIIQGPKYPVQNLNTIHQVSFQYQYLIPILDYGQGETTYFIVVPRFKSLREMLHSLSILQKFDLIKKLINVEGTFRNTHNINLIYNLDNIFLNELQQPFIMQNIKNFIPEIQPIFQTNQINDQLQAYRMFGSMLFYLLTEKTINLFSDLNIQINSIFLSEQQKSFLKQLMGLQKIENFSFSQIKILDLSYQNTYDNYVSIKQLNSESINSIDFRFHFTKEVQQFLNSKNQFHVELTKFEQEYRFQFIRVKQITAKSNERLEKLRGEFLKLQNLKQTICHNQDQIYTQLQQTLQNYKKLTREIGDSSFSDTQKNLSNILNDYIIFENLKPEFIQNFDQFLIQLNLNQLCNNIVQEYKNKANLQISEHMDILKKKIGDFNIKNNQFYIPEKVQEVERYQWWTLQQLEQDYSAKIQLLNDMNFSVRHQTLIIDLQEFKIQITDIVKSLKQYTFYEAELLRIGTYQIRNLENFQNNIKILEPTYKDKEFCKKIAFLIDEGKLSMQQIKKIVMDYLDLQ